MAGAAAESKQSIAVRRAKVRCFEASRRKQVEKLTFTESPPEF
jgi:hypothetical protein